MRLHWLMILPVGLSVVVGCASTWEDRLTLPGRHSLVREQLEVHSDFPLPAQHRLLEDLTARRFDVSRAAGLPVSDEPIHVYLFESAGRFNSFMRLHHPDFPQRRAFFVETDTRLTVYAHWGDRVAEDLRHEVTHGYLHSMVPNLPLWLDEGLAEYFEVPRGRGGVNRAHLEGLLARLQRGGWQPDLRRLEQLESVSAFDMTQEDYAESWAWVHFLLETGPQRAELFRAYVAELRRDGTAAPLWVRLGQMLGRPDAAVIEHVGHLARRDTARRDTARR